VIGGSIRVPSAFSGIFGIKPSVARLPHSGLSGVHGGMENIIGVVGPMATCNADLKLFCNVVLSSKPWLREPSLIELPWKRDVSIPRKLKIGVVNHDGVVQPHPPVTRCLKDTVKQLEAAGHEVVEWDTRLHKDLVKTIDDLYFLDGGEEYWEILSLGDEPPVPLMKWILEKGNPRARKVRETWEVSLTTRLRSGIVRLTIRS
jgi:amidase